MGDILAIIPARGGSKSIPRKNLQRIGGASLVARTIDTAHRATTVTRVVVSTNDDEIASEAARCGAEVVRRPSDISSDTAASELALLHALDYLRQREAYQPELTVFLQCTAPLTLPADIDGSVEVLRREHADSAFAAAPFHGFVWRRGASGEWEGVNHNKAERVLRQNRSPEFVEAGSVWVMRTAGFVERRHRLFGKIALFAIPPSRILDIDNPEDLLLAEALLQETAGK